MRVAQSGPDWAGLFLHLFPGTWPRQASALTLGLPGLGQAIGTGGDSWRGLCSSWLIYLGPWQEADREHLASSLVFH